MNNFLLPTLEIRLLGVPQIWRNGVVSVGLTSAKAQALLYYLAITGRTHTRAALATLLWSEHGESDARSNLRKVIQQLREHFAAYLAIDQQTVGFRAAQVYWVDAVEFARQSADIRTANPERLEQAIALYSGDFLEGFYVREAPAFETWMLSERARLRELMLQGVDALAVRYADEGNLLQAIATTRHLLELEPWREETHRQLMNWLAQNGQRSAALAQYELCCRALAEELAVEPSQATRDLYERLFNQNSSAPTGPTPPSLVTEYTLVGRQPQWKTLRSAWHRALQTGSHFVYISGEAGIGKTRLAEELLIDVQRQGYAAVRSRAYALEGRLAYAPLADWLRAETLQGKVIKLNQVWLSEVARLLPELLIQQPNLPAPQPLTDRWQQKRLFEALLHAFSVDSRPLLLLLDDLQWCDPETLAWLQYLLEAAPQARLLVIGTVRNDEVNDDHPLHKLSRNLLRAGKLTTIDLMPLNAEETAALSAQVTKQALDGKAATKLFQETAGNPLFVVESVLVGLRHGDRETRRQADVAAHFSKSPPPLVSVSNLPPKVYAVIQARLAQLSPTARTLAQWAATVGRTFTVALLMQASQQNEETVVRSLDELWQRRIVREQGSARYDFTHDRIRDVAYAESSPVKRALFHQRVAQALQKIHAQNLDPVAGELAMHYQHAGALEQALNYFRQAAQVAEQLYAHTERVDYLQKAIKVAEMLPHSPATAEIQADLWYELGVTQAVLHDWSSEMVANAWQRSYELATQADNTVQRCRALSWLGSVARHRGQWHKASEFVDRALALAEKTGDLFLIKKSLKNRGIMLYHSGDLAHALEHFKQDLRLLNALVPVTHEGVNDLPSDNFNRLAQCLWLLGFPDQSLGHAHRMLEARHQVLDFMDRLSTLDFIGMLYSFLRDAPMVKMLGEELVEFSTKYDFPFFASNGEMLAGWALAHQGDPPRGLSLMRRGIEEDRKRNIRMFEPHWRAMLAEILALAGELEEALDEVTAALAYAEESGNCYWNAHLLKLKGDFLHALSAADSEVEAWYQRALATARQQSARSLELRATISLARLWQQQGRAPEAHQLLAEIYGWFTEGFDTADLKEAKTLLDKLRTSAPGM